MPRKIRRNTKDKRTPKQPSRKTLTNKLDALEIKARHPKMKTKHKSLKSLRKEARRLFAKWVVFRDKGICFTCGKPGNQAGHYIHKDCLDYDEINNNCQCVRCNLWLSGNLGIYGERLIDKYGREEVDLLRQKSKKIKKWTVQELEDLIKTYER